MQAIETELKTLTFAGGDVFNYVTSAATFDPASAFQIAQTLPTAIVIFGGETEHEEHQHFALATFHIVVIDRHPSDASGRAALFEPDSVMDIVEKVRNQFFFRQDIGNEIWWSKTSAAQALKRQGDATGFLAFELTFDCMYQPITTA